jgi:endonuclease YncB( thermonuclease family)
MSPRRPQTQPPTAAPSLHHAASSRTGPNPTARLIQAAASHAAKAFVTNLLSPGDEVIVCTTKPDKYDRYLADVFLPKLFAQSSEASAKEGVFLNNELLRTGHAIRYEGGAKEV